MSYYWVCNVCDFIRTVFVHIPYIATLEVKSRYINTCINWHLLAIHQCGSSGVAIATCVFSVMTV